MIRTPVLMFLMVLAPSAAAGVEPARPHALTPIDQARHAAFLGHLSPGQAATLARRYPGFRILADCSGSFSGTARKDERVLGLWSAQAVHRVALIADGQAWALHDLDEEGRKDERYLQPWQYAFQPDGFVGPMKCGIAGEFSERSDLTPILGDTPFFDLKALGLANNKPVCFATSDVYNNWDCFVYVPSAGRFRLWYQQAHAD